MTTHDENYPGPVRLRGKPGARVRWGRKDRDTGFAVMEHIMQTTPPLVIPCQPGRMEKIKRCLRHNCTVPATDGVLRDLAALSDTGFREVSEDDTQFRVWAAEMVTKLEESGLIKTGDRGHRHD